MVGQEPAVGLVRGGTVLVQYLLELCDGLVSVLLLDGENNGLRRVRVQKRIALLEHGVEIQRVRPREGTGRAAREAVHQPEHLMLGVHAEADIEIAVPRGKLLADVERLALGEPGKLHVFRRAVMRAGQDDLAERQIVVELRHPVRRTGHLRAVCALEGGNDVHHGAEHQRKEQQDHQQQASENAQRRDSFLHRGGTSFGGSIVPCRRGEHK